MRKIAVCIKQIPFVEDANFDPVTKTIKRDGPVVISAFDTRALALAIQLKEQFGAQTTVVTMGPPQAQSALREALAMGIDRAVHLQDRAFAGSDTNATARALALWLGRESFDLILLGRYSLDAETGQVGPEIAELLGIAQITGVRKLQVEGGLLRAERESDEGFDEVECAMPALLTCAERVAQPIRVKPEASEQAKQKAIETVAAADLGGDPSEFGFSGSPTWVTEVHAQPAPVNECTFIDGSDPSRAAEELLEALDRVGALSPRPRALRPVSAGVRTCARSTEIWVVCETDFKGEVTRGTLELLSRADTMAARLAGAVVAITFDSASGHHADRLASYGADRVVILDNPALESYAPESFAQAVASLLGGDPPWALLLVASDRGRDWGPRLAARLGLGMTGDAVGLEVDEQGRMIALKPAFGGNIVAPIATRTYPQMATVRPGVLEIAEPDPSRKAAIERQHLAIDQPLSRLVQSHLLLDPSIAPLEGADIVVGVGAGIGGPEGAARLKELAAALGAGLSASRRVTDAGWLPRQLQVGLTGKAIDPNLYIAVGLRGAPNHLVGIKQARYVAAINNDPEAPIFERASLGVVADWETFVPALISAVRLRAARNQSA